MHAAKKNNLLRRRFFTVMNVFSTNQLVPHTTFGKAAVKGMASDGGLYLPVTIPTVSKSFLAKLPRLSFQETAFELASILLSDELSPSVLKKAVQKAFFFDAPLVKVSENMYSLELFHGPTLAFKDFGAQFMAQVLSHFVKKSKSKVTILVATSGDTGSAVASGFLNTPNINVIILYPKGKISHTQEQQITTAGHNVQALEVAGTFDDCQNLVRGAFLDDELNEHLLMTSANSINIARLLPQIFYYFYAYGQLKNRDLPLVFSVPSGNFGNLIAGIMAKRMGLPVDQLIAATNANDTIPVYLKTGDFVPKKSVHTLSNAMDCGNPNNFTRLKALYGYSLSEMRKDITGGSFSDAQTKQAIKEVYKEHAYLLDPHSAVGYLGIKEYLKKKKMATSMPNNFSAFKKYLLKIKN